MASILPSDDEIKFTGVGKVNGKDIEVHFKTIGAFIDLDFEDKYDPKIVINPIKDSDRSLMRVIDVEEYNKGRLKEMDNKVIVGDTVITESGERFFFAADDNEPYTPYYQINATTYDVVDMYPAKLFENEVKLGYEMTIGGKITDVIKN